MPEISKKLREEMVKRRDIALQKLEDEHGAAFAATVMCVCETFYTKRPNSVWGWILNVGHELDKLTGRPVVFMDDLMAPDSAYEVVLPEAPDGEDALTYAKRVADGVITLLNEYKAPYIDKYC